MNGLRSFLRDLEDAGELLPVSDTASILEVASLIARHRRAVLVEDVRGYRFPVLANAMATRRRWAIALGVGDTEVRAEVARRSARRIKPRVLEDAPVHQVVRTGADVNLTELPAYLQHDDDGAPYLSAAMDISVLAGSGSVNLGMRRLMLRGPAETGVDIVAPSDLRASYRRAREHGEDLEVAFVIGAHPLDYLASQLKVGADDDFALAGGLRGEPLPLVRAATVDILVPADAELVLEGRIVGDPDEVEGPYGEYHGCRTGTHRNPLFQVSALTRRRDAIFQSATIGNPSLAHTDTAGIAALKGEAMVWGALERAVGVPLDVYCPPASGGRHHVRISLVNRDLGDARNALYAALSCQADIKLAMVFDEDIDIYDDEQVEWALSTRYQADRDTLVLSGLRTLPLEPSLPERTADGTVTAKLGLDVTRRRDKPARVFEAPQVPDPARFSADALAALPGQVSMVDAVAAVQAALTEPRTFYELLLALPRLHQSDVVRGLAELRASGVVAMTGDGRYSLCATSELVNGEHR